MSEFAALFRSHVGPRLRRACHYHGGMMMLGHEEWHDAYEGVLQFAIRLGASYLPERLLLDLENQIAEWLYAALLAWEERWRDAMKLIPPKFRPPPPSLDPDYDPADDA